MDLYKKLVKVLDRDFGYDNEALAKKLAEISKKHFEKKLKK